VRPLHRTVAACALLLSAAAVSAQSSLSTRAITWVSPFPPGGGTDTLTRMVGGAVAEAQGWNVVIENKPGGGGNLALNFVAKARPDGHTLVMAQTDNIVLNPHLYKTLPYDTFKDFRPVVMVAASPTVFVVMADSPYKTLDDVVRAAKANPGKITLGIPGAGGSGDLIGHLWRKSAGIALEHVPYRGYSQAFPDLVSHRIDMWAGSAGTLLPHISAGTVRALGVVAAQRAPALPDVPTFVESGFPSIDQALWWGLMTTAGTPDAVVAEMNAAVNAALRQPALIKRLQESGYSVIGGSPQDLAQSYKADHDLFGTIVQQAGIQPQ